MVINLKTRLSELIASTATNRDDQELWDKIIRITPGQELEKIWDLLSAHPAYLEFLSKNLRMKIEATSGTDDMWNKILEEESAALDRAEKQ